MCSCNIYVAHIFCQFLLFQISDLANEDTPQLYAACGRGPRSSLRVLRHGLEVTEMAVSELPGNPHAVWTVKKDSKGKLIFYITHAPLIHFLLHLIFTSLSLSLSLLSPPLSPLPLSLSPLSPIRGV